MSIQGHLAKVIEANRISGVRGYGDYVYRERHPNYELQVAEAKWYVEQQRKGKQNDITATTESN
jgi:hypothetical protein